MNDKVKEKKNINIYLLYTIIFFVMLIIVFWIFIIKNKSFIWQADGLKQHYIILQHFNEIIRGFLLNPSQGLDLFSWNIGTGLDVIGQYSYYIIGDPFAYISLLFPMKHLEIVYTMLIPLRMFCIGISFITYAKYHKHSKTNILIGAIVYTFSAFTLYAGVRHPYFLNAMIIFPMLLLGIDKLLQENKKVFLTIWIAISAISNYYFFYMHIIMIVIYAIIRFICEYKSSGIKIFWKKVGTALICCVIGILIAAIILMPTIYAFFNSARADEQAIRQYDINYYGSLFTISLLTANAGNWSFIGISAIVLLMLPILWIRRKQHFTYFIYWLIATVMLLIPFIGSVMNGFSFPNNRWSFIYTFIIAYIVTLCFDTNYSKKEKKGIAIFLVLYSIFGIIALIIGKQKDGNAIIYLLEIVLAFLMMWIVFKKCKPDINEKNSFRYNGMLISLAFISIGIMAFGLYSSYGKNYANEFIKLNDSEEKIATQLGDNKPYNENIATTKQQDDTFYRIAKLPHTVQNMSIMYQYPSTEMFLSIGNQYIYKLCQELADTTHTTTSCIRGLNDRTKITTLFATKYYITDNKHENSVPYGYKLKEQKQEVKTYENQYPLSIGVFYDQYMLKENYEKLNPIEKEDAMLKVAVLEKHQEISNFNMQEKTQISDIKNANQSAKYELIDKDNIYHKEEKVELNDKIITKNNYVQTTKNDQSIVLKIPKITNSELYVHIKNFSFDGSKKHTIKVNYKGKSVSKTVENKITSAYYQPTPQILFNLGYYEETQGEIKLTFSTKGKYYFGEIEVLSAPMNSYSETIEKLQQNQLQEVTVTNKQIKGNITATSDGVLQISTGYTIGWKAYVDGKPIDTFIVNTAFIGIPIEKGQHEIVLKYEVPYLNIGIYMSIIGIVSLTILIVYEKRQLKIKENGF